MVGRPSILDNLQPDTGHGDGLVYLTNDLDEHHGLSVATGYVNLGGLHHVAESVGEDRATRLLLGAAPRSGLGSEFPATLFERTLLALRKERDLSRFPASRALKKLMAIADWLERPNVEVRRYVAKFLHGKAYLFGDGVDARAAPGHVSEPDGSRDVAEPGTRPSPLRSRGREARHQLVRRFVGGSDRL